MRPDEAIQIARATVGASPAIAARVWTVRRLDKPLTYELVVLGGPGAATAVVAIDSQRAEPTSHAALPGHADHLVVDEGEARKQAGVGDDAAVELVWAPSALSRSPLYPFWEIRSQHAVRYVDQRGVVSSGLGSTRHGG